MDLLLTYAPIGSYCLTASRKTKNPKRLSLPLSQRVYTPRPNERVADSGECQKNVRMRNTKNCKAQAGISFQPFLE